MKGLLILSVVVLGLALVGWLKFSNSDAQTTITIDKQEVKKDAEKVVEKSKEVLKDVKEKTDEALDQKEQPSEDDINSREPGEADQVQDFDRLKLRPDSQPIEK